MQCKHQIQPYQNFQWLILEISFNTTVHGHQTICHFLHIAVDISNGVYYPFIVYVGTLSIKLQLERWNENHSVRANIVLHMPDQKFNLWAPQQPTHNEWLEMHRRPRKFIKMKEALHMKSNINRIYAPRKTWKWPYQCWNCIRRGKMDLKHSLA